MNLNFFEFLRALVENPILFVITLLIGGVIFANGCTDVPNSISTCVATRSMSPKKALIMAAICNALGVFLIKAVGSNVANTVYSIVNFGDNSYHALVALCAALFAIVIWSFITWFFGIPTSQSHSLVAGLTGAAVAINGGFNGVSLDAWKKVILGLIISTIFGFIFGFLITKLIRFLFKNIDRRRTKPIFKIGLIIGDSIQAFFNSLQDGQKFIAVFLMGLMLTNGVTDGDIPEIPIWTMIFCSTIMTLGTAIAGNRIIKSVGMKIAKMETYQGTSSDIAASICLLGSTLTGLPVSTNQTKTTAIMGVGAANRVSSVDWSIAKNMILAWVITFPSAGLLGFIMTKSFIVFFG